MKKILKKYKYSILELLTSSLLIFISILIGSIAIMFFMVILLYIIEEGENLRKKKEYIHY